MNRSGSQLQELPWQRPVPLPRDTHSGRQHDTRTQRRESVESDREKELEKECTLLRLQLSRSRDQHLSIQQKARDLSEIMQRLYKQYNELEKTLKEKEGDICTLKQRLVSLECKSGTLSSTPSAPSSDFCQHCLQREERIRQLEAVLSTVAELSSGVLPQAGLSLSALQSPSLSLPTNLQSASSDVASLDTAATEPSRDDMRAPFAES